MPLPHRVREAHRLLGRSDEPFDWGADTVAYLADDMLQVDEEWSLRGERSVVWLPHHQRQWLRASAPFEDAGTIIGTVAIETTIASAPADSTTDERLNDFNLRTALATLVRSDEGQVVIHTSIPVHEQNMWWMPRWLADLAVLHLMEADTVAVDTAEGQLPGGRLPRRLRNAWPPTRRT